MVQAITRVALSRQNMEAQANKVLKGAQLPCYYAVVPVNANFLPGQELKFRQVHLRGRISVRIMGGKYQ
jgi:hypothetical protein